MNKLQKANALMFLLELELMRGSNTEEENMELFFSYAKKDLEFRRKA